jgi:hypothetical protein
MNLSAEKLDIIQRICEIQDNDLIDQIRKKNEKWLKD